jgi:hypothetical protein
MRLNRAYGSAVANLQNAAASTSVISIDGAQRPIVNKRRKLILPKQSQSRNYDADRRAEPAPIHI